MKEGELATALGVGFPQETRLAGAAALVYELAVAAPVRRPSCVADQHVSGSRRAEGAWTIFDKRYWPGDELADHLKFLLKHEDADLLVLRRIFDALPQAGIEATVRAARGRHRSAGHEGLLHRHAAPLEAPSGAR